MKKDLKELANKYQSLSDTEKVDLEVKAHAEVTSKWFLNRPTEINKLIECGWFHLQEFGLATSEDRLRLKERIVSEIPEAETKENLKSASDLISDYFAIVVKLLENPELIKSEPPGQDDSGEWGTEEGPCLKILDQFKHQFALRILSPPVESSPVSNRLMGKLAPA